MPFYECFLYVSTHLAWLPPIRAASRLIDPAAQQQQVDILRRQPARSAHIGLRRIQRAVFKPRLGAHDERPDLFSGILRNFQSQARGRLRRLHIAQLQRRFRSAAAKPRILRREGQPAHKGVIGHLRFFSGQEAVAGLSEHDGATHIGRRDRALGRCAKARGAGAGMVQCDQGQRNAVFGRPTAALVAPGERVFIRRLAVFGDRRKTGGVALRSGVDDNDLQDGGGDTGEHGDDFLSIPYRVALAPIKLTWSAKPGASMPQPHTALIIGFGYSANATARRLIAAGWRVTGTTRRLDRTASIIAAGAAPLVTDPATQHGALALCEAATAADAVISSVPPDVDGDPVLRALASADLSAKRLVYFSTTGVYGDRQGGWAFEWDPVTPGQDRSKRRARAEAEWLAKGALSLRLGGIYGPGRSALERLKTGRPVVDKPGQVFSRIHVDDIAGAVLKALERPDVSGAVNLVDDAPSSQADHMRAVAKMAGLPAPRIIGHDDAALSPMAASFFAECRRVSNAKAKQLLGWRPEFPDALTGTRASA